VKPQGLRCVGYEVALLAGEGEPAVKGLMVFVEGSLAGGLEVTLVAGVLHLIVDSIDVLFETHLSVGNVVTGRALERSNHIFVCTYPRQLPFLWTLCCIL